ncbi:MAG: SDR family NAD(P)-dependent oxidoreductase [Pseudomonadota bacterium]
MGHGFQFDGKTAVVTGGASGLGLAIAEELTRRGARVGLADIEMDRACTAAFALSLGRAEVKPFAVDVADADSVEALADAAWREFGRVDAVFNNAGVGGGRDLIGTRETDFDWIWSVNVKGVWNGCRSFGARFQDQDGHALIVNTGSEHSLGVPHLNQGIYTASKHAVHGMTDVLRRETPDRIQVSLFCPGIVATEIWNSSRNRPDAFGGAKQANALGRTIMDYGMQADDVARRALDGVEAGEFYIVTHPHNKKMIKARHEEMVQAFDAQTGRIDGDRFDMDTILANIMP